MADDEVDWLAVPAVSDSSASDSGEEDEVDWLAAIPVPAAPVQPAPDMPPLPPPAGPPPPDAVANIPAAAPRRAKAKFCSLKLNRPGHRTAEENHLVASLMRERRARKSKRDECEQMRDDVQAALHEVSKDLSRGDIGLKVVRRKKRAAGFQIVSSRLRGAGVRHGLTHRRILDLSFSPVHEHRKLAAFYGLSDTHIRRVP